MSLRSTIFAYLLLGGGLMIALVQVPLSLGISSDLPRLGSSLLGIIIGGSAVGGLLFGRLGPHAFARTSLPLTLLELSLATVAVVSTSLIVITIEPNIVGPESATLARILISAGLGLGSALVGGWLGHAIRSRKSRLLDALTFVAVTGGSYLLIGKLIMVMSLLSKAAVLALSLTAFFVLPIVCGFLCRYLTGKRTVRVIVHGTTLICGLVALIVILEAYRHSDSFEAIAGTFGVGMIGLIFFGLSCAGAAIASKFDIRPVRAAFEMDGHDSVNGQQSRPTVAEARLVE